MSSTQGETATNAWRTRIYSGSTNVVTNGYVLDDIVVARHVISTHVVGGNVSVQGNPGNATLSLPKGKVIVEDVEFNDNHIKPVGSLTQDLVLSGAGPDGRVVIASSVSLEGGSLQGLPPPTTGDSAATKDYVDTLVDTHSEAHKIQFFNEGTVQPQPGVLVNIDVWPVPGTLFFRTINGTTDLWGTVGGVLLPTPDTGHMFSIVVPDLRPQGQAHGSGTLLADTLVGLVNPVAIRVLPHQDGLTAEFHCSTTMFWGTSGTLTFKISFL